MGKGKKGKALFSLVGFFLGAGHVGQALFGAKTAIVGGLYGASLAGTLWSTFNKPKTPNFDYGEGVQRFDKVMNTMTTTAVIPVIYGERKWGGNQTYHKTNPDLNILQKGIVARISRQTVIRKISFICWIRAKPTSERTAS